MKDDGTGIWCLEGDEYTVTYENGNIIEATTNDPSVYPYEIKDGVLTLTLVEGEVIYYYQLVS